MVQSSAVLLVIDPRSTIDDPRWTADGSRNNPGPEAAVGQRVAAWRAARWPIFHVRHDSIEAESTFRPGQPGNGFKPEAMSLPDEMVIAKGRAFARLIDRCVGQLRAVAGPVNHM